MPEPRRPRPASTSRDGAAVVVKQEPPAHDLARLHRRLTDHHKTALRDTTRRRPNFPPTPD